MAKPVSPKLTFMVAKKPRHIPGTGNWLGVLLYDNWNDYGYYTSYVLSVFDGDGKLHDIGHVRIASSAMVEEFTVVLPESPFTRLDSSYFSLGAEQEYYENLKQLPKLLRDMILVSLCDMAFDDDIWNTYRNEKVTSTALLRGKSANTVREQYHRIAHGGAVLTPFEFSFEVPTPSDGVPFNIVFKVDPDTHTPPTNVHALIGRNGCGKTFTLRFLAEKSMKSAMPVRLGSTNAKASKDSISGLVYVSFSPFEKLHRELLPGPDTMPFPIARISLHEPMSNDAVHVKSPDDLTAEFIHSIGECAALDRYDRWQAAIRLLDTDPGFADHRIADIEEMPGRKIRKQMLGRIFNGLSSGHKIVLLTLTRLVECTAEKSLVLIDEPETHLHPPLLSSFVRAVSRIMLDRNGVAIVATHSPVVLQEVPRKCVWKLERFGELIVANRPELETFGENVGTLTREVFGYEVMNSGFHRLLTKIVADSGSVNEVLNKFDGQLGGEAQAIVHGLLKLKNKRGGSSNA